jgi:hypothetical protein
MVQPAVERTAFVSAPRAALSPGTMLGSRSSTFGSLARNSSGNRDSGSVNGCTGSPVKTRAMQEFEFDGRMAGSGGRDGKPGVRGEPGERAFEDHIVHSIADFVDGLNTGTDAQRSLILFEVQQLISHSHSVEYALKTLVPVICEHVGRWSQELQISAAESMVGLQAAKLPHEQAVTIMETAFGVLRQNQDPNMFRAWGEILVSILPHVKWTHTELEKILENLDKQSAADSASTSAAGKGIKSGPWRAAAVGGKPISPKGVLPAHIADIALSVGHQNAGAASPASELAQKLTARIIGPVAVSAKPELVKNVLLTRALELTSEKDIEVRGMVVESMAFIGAAVDIDTVQERMWPSLLSLVRDPNARLHAATLRTIARIAAAHRKSTPSAPFYSILLPPVFIRECQFLKKQAQADQRLVDEDTDLLIEINAEIFGELLFSCCRFLSDEVSRKDAFRAYQAMATCNGPVVRRHCAFNIPGVSLAFLSRYRAEVATIVEFLSRDADNETRWNLAAGMHETARTLVADDTLDNLFKAMNALLHDGSPLVRMNVLQNFDNLLGTLTSHNPYKAIGKLETVFQNLQLLSVGNWRTQELLAKQLRLVAPLVPPQCIRANVLPLLYQLTDESSYIVRKASMAAVAVCMRYIPDTTERDEVMENFRLEWGRGAVFWMRIGFIDSAEAAVETYSRILFRDTFATEILRLANDSVPNVRIRAAKLLPRIAPACHQMEEFHAALGTFKLDADQDVLDALKNVEQKIQQQLDAGKMSFERDMSREAEEQNLYTKHLQLKAEVNKKRTSVKHNTRALLEALSPRNGPSSAAGSATGGANASEAVLNDPDFLGGKRKLPRSSTLTSIKGTHARTSQSQGQGEVNVPRVARLPRAASMTGRPVRHSQPVIPVNLNASHDDLTRHSKSGSVATVTSPASVQRAEYRLERAPSSDKQQFNLHSSKSSRGSVKTLLVRMSPRSKKQTPAEATNPSR